MTDDTDEDIEEVTLSGAFEFASEMAGEEVDQFEGDVPKHAARLIAARSTDLMQSLINIEMAEASEKAQDPEQEQIQKVVVQDAVDIFLALGTLVYEYDIDIAEAFEERKSLIEDYKKFEDAISDAETEEEVLDAVDEYMTEELEAMMGGGMGALGGATPLEPGDNVDAEDYDHDETGKSFA